MQEKSQNLSEKFKEEPKICPALMAAWLLDIQPSKLSGALD